LTASSFKALRAGFKFQVSGFNFYNGKIENFSENWKIMRIIG